MNKEAIELAEKCGAYTCSNEFMYMEQDEYGMNISQISAFYTEARKPLLERIAELEASQAEVAKLQAARTVRTNKNADIFAQIAQFHGQQDYEALAGLANELMERIKTMQSEHAQQMKENNLRFEQFERTLAYNVLVRCKAEAKLDAARGQEPAAWLREVKAKVLEDAAEWIKENLRSDMLPEVELGCMAADMRKQK
jgi:hypothetical protein